jgi:hypothetical protein
MAFGPSLARVRSISRRFFAILEQAGFSGWLIVETDVTQLPSALESALISRSYLREQLGM